MQDGAQRSGSPLSFSPPTDDDLLTLLRPANPTFVQDDGVLLI